MISNKCRIKKNDKVRVTTGKDKDKVGKVLRVIPKKNRIVVEKVNIVKCHTKPNAQGREGGIVEREAPIHVSNVMLTCDKCMKPVRVKIKKLEDGKKARYCMKCNETIDTK